MNCVDYLWDWVQRCPGRLALQVDDRQWTYADLVSAVGAMATALSDSGIRPGARVLLALPTSAEFVVAYHAALAVGATVVTVNPASTPREMDYFLADSDSSLVIGCAENAETVTSCGDIRGIAVRILGPGQDTSTDSSSFVPVVRDENDVAVLLYTSGTTGAPKGAELTHRNVAVCADTVGQWLRLTPIDRVATALPLFHIYGQVVVMGSALRHGAATFLIRPFTAPAVVRLVEDEAITVLAGVPTMWTDMLNTVDAGRDVRLSRLRITLSGGAGLPREVAQAFSRRFGATIVEGYGLSEATGVATMNSTDGVTKPDSVGRALPGVEVAVLDASLLPVAPGESGEVVIRGPVIMRGYRNRPDATAQAIRDGWLLTGDIGHLDAEGYLWIVDRKKDMVIRGGYNVYPREIEEVLYQHPSVREAAVIGIPDPRVGEEVAAVVAMRVGADTDGPQLRGWLSERLAAYKVPRIYVTVDELPKGPTGKIMKRAIDKSWVAATGVRVTSAQR